MVWKLLFPRIGDTFVTIDTLLDLTEWKQLYETMQCLTDQFEVVTLPVELMIGRYKIQIDHINDPLELQCLERIGVDVNLLHSKIMSLNLSVNQEYTEFMIEMLAEGINSPRKNDDGLNTSSTSNEISKKRSSTFGIDTKENLCNKQSKKSHVLQNTTDSTFERYKHSSFHNRSSDSIPRLELLDKQKKLNVGDLTLEQNERHKAFFYNEINNIQSYDTCHHNTTLNSDKDAIIPHNLEEFRGLMKNEEYLRRFGFEDNVKGEYNFRLFDNIYTTSNGTTYASFHSTKVIRHFKGGSCRLFFCYSDEILNKFKELKFDGVAHILFVFVNVAFDRITPFGVFLLPSKDEAVLGDVILSINGWLNDEESKCKTVINTCTAPGDIALHRSIGKVWSATKIIGCSLEFQRDLKEFRSGTGGKASYVKNESTKLAMSLCYLPEQHIRTGIDVIKQCSYSYYGTELAQYIVTKWLPLSISVYDEGIHTRSTLVCTKFFERITKVNSGHRLSFKSIYDFVGFLRTLFSIEESVINLPPKISIGYNTELQIQKEIKLRYAMNYFKKEKEPVKDYMLKLMHL